MQCSCHWGKFPAGSRNGSAGSALLCFTRLTVWLLCIRPYLSSSTVCSIHLQQFFSASQLSSFLVRSPCSWRWRRRHAIGICPPKHASSAVINQQGMYLEIWYVEMALWQSKEYALSCAGEIIPQSICSRYGLAVGAYSAYFVRALMILCGVVAYPISKILDWVLGPEQEVSSSWWPDNAQHCARKYRGFWWEGQDLLQRHYVSGWWPSLHFSHHTTLWCWFQKFALLYSAEWIAQFTSSVDNIWFKFALFQFQNIAGCLQKAAIQGFGQYSQSGRGLGRQSVFRRDLGDSGSLGFGEQASVRLHDAPRQGMPWQPNIFSTWSVHYWP